MVWEDPTADRSAFLLRAAGSAFPLEPQTHGLGETGTQLDELRVRHSRGRSDYRRRRADNARARAAQHPGWPIAWRRFVNLIDRQFQRLAESVHYEEARDFQTSSAYREERFASNARHGAERVERLIEPVIDGGMDGSKFIGFT